MPYSGTWQSAPVLHPAPLLKLKQIKAFVSWGEEKYIEGGWSQAGKLQALQIFMFSVIFQSGSLKGQMTRNIRFASAVLEVTARFRS